MFFLFLIASHCMLIFTSSYSSSSSLRTTGLQFSKGVDLETGMFINCCESNFLIHEGQAPGISFLQTGHTASTKIQS